jgi:hypothetical protein
MRKNSFLAAVAVLVTVLLSGCGAQPPKANIDYGVNWAISSQLEWADKTRDLFDSYKITNRYVEKSGEGKNYVYDYEAQCPVEDFSPPGQSFPRFWHQINTVDNPTPDDRRKTVTITGSFTLTKKGNEWYCSATIR